MNRKAMQMELSLWREALSQEQILKLSNNKQNKITVGILAAGAGVCTYSSVRSGFRPIWCTETSKTASEIWKQLYNSECLGDTFDVNWREVERPWYLTSGQPCPDYSRSGSKKGRHGKTGWMFVDQVDEILKIRPICFRLEISDYIWQINNGEEIKKVLNRLRKFYDVKHVILDVWKYGDVSSRRRLIIVGFIKQLQGACDMFEFPAASYDEQHCHCARDVAVDDEDVPEKYWRYDTVKTVVTKDEETYQAKLPNKLIKLASQGEGMGPAHAPNGIYSWDGPFNTQTTLNGGGRRPSLKWKNEDDKIGATRMTLPIEAIRVASLPSWFMEVIRQHSDEDEDVFKCVNNGIPARLSTAIDQKVMSVIKALGDEVQKVYDKTQNMIMNDRQWQTNFYNNNAITNEQTKLRVFMTKAISKEFENCGNQAFRVKALATKRKRSAMMDTGANVSLFHRDVEGSMKNPKRSKLRIQVANSDEMQGKTEGDLIMKTKGADVEERVTSVDGLPHELFSVDNKYYVEKYNVLLTHEDFTVTCECCQGQTHIGDPRLAKRSDGAEVSVPIRTSESEGGFWLDYELKSNEATDDGGWLYNEEQSYDMIRRTAMNAHVTEVIFGDERTPLNIRGAKSSLKSDKQKMTAKQFHEDYVHMGSCPGCAICRMLKGAMRRITRIVDKHREIRRAHTWVMDTVTLNMVSLCGCRFMIVLRCKGFRYYHAIFLKKKSESTAEVEKWIIGMRADPMFQNMVYDAVQFIETDSAGEWDPRCAEWDKMNKRCKMQTVWTCPDRKEEAGIAERACAVVEIALKAGLMQENLPGSWWVRTAKQAVWLMNRFGALVSEAVIPADGDQVRPLEEMTGFAYSRKQINRELSYFVPVGRVALVHRTKVKGSAIEPKSRWAVAIEMYREQVMWWSPYTKQDFRSKSFSAFKLRAGMNYMHFLGLPITSGAQGENTLPADFHQKVTITLPKMKDMDNSQAIAAEPSPVVHMKHAMDDITPQLNQTTNRIESQTVRKGDDSADEEEDDQLIDAVESNLPVVTADGYSRELGGSVEILGPNGGTLNIDPDTGELLEESATAITVEETVSKQKLQANEKEEAKSSGPHSNDGSVVGATSWKEDSQLYDLAEEAKVKQFTITTSINDSMIQMMKKLKIPFEHHSLYRKWMLKTQKSPEESKLVKEDLPEGRNKLRPGLTFKKPSGKHWEYLTGKESDSVYVCNQKLAEASIQEAMKELRLQKDEVRRTGKINFAQQKETIGWAFKVKKKRSKAVAGDAEELPKNTRACLESERGVDWCASIDAEMDGLTDMGVIEHGFTRLQCQNMGISLECPIILVHDLKFDAQGIIDRLKSRAALQGSKNNMQKGVHFWETFTATPREDTARVLQCMMVNRGWFRLACDIKQAYCWAELPQKQWMIATYPDGLQRTNDAGEETVMIVKKNLYGGPASGRNWGKLRDYTMVSVFNDEKVRKKMEFAMKRDEINLSDRAQSVIDSHDTDGWQCKQCEMDPCLFVLTSPEGRPVIAMIHTDDIDAIGEREEDIQFIFDILDRIWKIKMVDAGYVLGISRKLIRDEEDRLDAVELTMTPYVEGMCEVFKMYLPDGTVNTPFPEKTMLAKGDADTDEINEVINAGYQRAVGMILWAVRHVFIEGKYGVSVLCSVMAYPSWKAFKAAMHMIRYMGQRAHRGIKFSARGNMIPFGMFDASNKAHIDDSLAHAGYLNLWMGGPVMAWSKKLRHIGHSSEHNEFMAMAALIKALIWFRQLLEECGFGECVKEPTIIFGDNVAANNLSEEHFVSTGNQYIYITYHFNREATRLGLVQVKWVKSAMNLSDALTKALSNQQLNHAEQGMLKYITGYANVEDFKSMLETIMDIDCMRKLK